jgi:hypothetical protein
MRETDKRNSGGIYRAGIVFAAFVLGQVLLPWQPYQ